jgi:DNA topoisomerase-6 subunit B
VARKRTGDGSVFLELSNYTQNRVDVSLYDLSGDPASDAEPAPDFVTHVEEEFTKVWKVSIEPGRSWGTRYTGHGGGAMEIRGVDPREVVVVDLDE